MDVSIGARDLNEYARSMIVRDGFLPESVRYPDGFVAGRGDWATEGRQIPRLVPWEDRMAGWLNMYLHAMAFFWENAGSAILMDYRDVHIPKYFASDKADLDRIHPGLFESSGAAFCFRQAAQYESAIDEDALEYEWDTARGGDYEITMPGCLLASQVSGRQFVPEMYGAIQIQSSAAYPQKSVAKTLTDDRGSVVKAAPWSWKDFEMYCEETVFLNAVRQGIELLKYDPEESCTAASNLVIEKGVYKQWGKGPNGGQIARIVWEYGAFSAGAISYDNCSILMAQAAMYSISKGGDREMFRKLDAYEDGRTPYEQNSRGSYRRR